MLDFGGGTFAPMAELPHVAGVGDPLRARRRTPRSWPRSPGIVDRREAYFRRAGHRLDRDLPRAAGGRARADDGYGDVFLVVDGWSTLRADFDELEMELQALAQRGLTFGLHLVAGAARWADFRAAIRDLFGDPSRAAARRPASTPRSTASSPQLVPTGRPGRGLVAGKLHFLAALPRVDGARRRAHGRRRRRGPRRAVPQGVDRPPGPKLRLLPERIELDPAARAGRTGRSPGRRSTSAVDERDLAPVGLDVDARAAPAGLRRQPVRQERAAAHLRPRGDAHPHRPGRRRSSSSTTAARCSGEVPEEYLLHYLTAATQAEPAIARAGGVPPEPAARAPTSRPTSCATGPGGPAPRSSSSSTTTTWWPPSPARRSLPLRAAAGAGPRRRPAPGRWPAAPAARPARSTSRCIQSLRDLAMPGLLLSGSPDEGPLIGTAKPRKAVPGPRPAGHPRPRRRGRADGLDRPDALRPGPDAARVKVTQARVGG